MALYIHTPKESNDIKIVVVGGSLKTLMQVATPSTTAIRIFGWGLTFGGIVPTSPPGEVQLVDVDVAATVTAQSPDDWGSADAQNSLCVGGTGATGQDASVEGTITDSRILDPRHVHPQMGYGVWFPSDARPTVEKSRFLRIRAIFSVPVNTIPWIVWQEPA